VILLKMLRTGCETLELDDQALTQRLLADDLQVYITQPIAPRLLRILIASYRITIGHDACAGTPASTIEIGDPVEQVGLNVFLR
jgi:hypothetical protein